MARSQLADVFSHWSKLFENFETSSLDFYVAVEAALERRKMPGLFTSRVVFKEGGTFSAQREYLRICRERLVFDVCAAPFGTGFFFSWWLVEKRFRWPPIGFLITLVGLYVTLILVSLPVGLLSMATARTDLRAVPQVGRLLLRYSDSQFVLIPLGFTVFFLLVRAAAKAGFSLAEEIVLSAPGFGWLYERLFIPATYYQLDTISMYQAAVHGAVTEVIDGLTNAKGLRGLTEDERKPIMKDFLRK